MMMRHRSGVAPVFATWATLAFSCALSTTASAEALPERGTIATRQYGKRQYTWFSRQPPADWPRLVTQLDDFSADQIAIKLQDQVLTA